LLPAYDSRADGAVHRRNVRERTPIRGQITAHHFRERAMTNEFKAGDKVEWQASQGAVQGTVKKKLTAHTAIKGHEVAASKDHPEYLVVSDKTGAEAAHMGSALKKI
jgi:hypothetical protein